MDDSTKEALLRQFQAFLEHLPDDGPEQQSPEAGIDLYSLYSELAGLKNEVRIESRQLKAALDDFREVFAALDGANRNLTARFEELQQEKKQLEKAALKPVISGLLDIYDRLAAAAAQEPVPARSIFAGFCRREREWMRLQVEGQRMTLRRLLDLLAQCGVQPVFAENMLFDPRVMQAAGTDHRPGLAEGAVVSELRKGFTWDGSLLRAAEVLVNKLHVKTE